MSALTRHDRGFASIRRNYGVGVGYGVRATYRGGERPLHGRLISSDGQYVYMRLNNGRRFGPLHPTWKMTYYVSVTDD